MPVTARTYQRRGKVVFAEPRPGDGGPDFNRAVVADPGDLMERVP